MRSPSYTLAILAILALMSATWAGETSSDPTFTIAGTLGLPGVTMQGLPGAPLTDENGRYVAKVPLGWRGTVTPIRLGYAFRPRQRTYDAVKQDSRTEDYTALMLTFTISGNTGVGGATMDGLPGRVVTDSQGMYRAQVVYGWSGTVSPSKEGYSFEPASLRYDRVTKDCVNDNYRAQTITYTISGSAGLSGVVMQGLPENPMTDASGRYSVQVLYGWAGRVVPTKQGCSFEPESRDYTRMTTDQHNQSYTPVRVSVAPSQSYGAGVMDVLVIPASQVDPKAVGEIKEDMQVMVHILREMLSEPRMILGILYDYGDIFGNSDRGTRAFYLEGYGALFVMEVDFPFSSPSEDRLENAPEQTVDPVWQRARQRLRAPGARRAYGQGIGDEMSFEQFKEDLIETLKHAANIRHIDPNENIILTIIGQDAGAARFDFSGARGAFPGGTSGAFQGSSYSAAGGSFTPYGGSTYANSYTYSGPTDGRSPGTTRQSTTAPASTTVLTIQAKKADIDAFATGQIDLEQFQQRVKVLTY